MKYEKDFEEIKWLVKKISKTTRKCVKSGDFSKIKRDIESAFDIFKQTPGYGPPNNGPHVEEPGDPPPIYRPHVREPGDPPPIYRPHVREPGDPPPKYRPHVREPGDPPPKYRPHVREPGDPPPKYRPHVREPGDPPPKYRPHVREPGDPPVYPADSAPSANKKVKKKSAKSVMGILLIVFGSLSAAAMTLLFTLFGTAAFFLQPSTNVYVVSFLVYLLLTFGISGGMIFKGTALCSRAKRYQKYLDVINGCKFCPIKMLAGAVDKTPQFVAKDLQRMIRAGQFPQAHLDTQKTCIILDNETYQQYLNAQQRMLERRKEQERREDSLSRPAKTGDKELDAIINDGRKYIREINQANLLIQGEVISQKLTRLEEVTTKIFDYVAQHPEKLPDIRKFMNYYLPTTLKLLHAYCEFEAQPIEGENIASAKKEIQDTLDTINSAFENLLDSLFQDDAFDVASDISALETMLAQEGLTDSDFKKKKP